MDFRKRERNRFIYAIAIGIIGLTFIGINFYKSNDIMFSLGISYFLISFIRIKRHLNLLKDKDLYKKREISETDERNIMLWTKARSLALSVCIYLQAVAIIVLTLLGKHIYVDILSISLMTIVIIYWICYLYIRKKN